VTVASPVNAVTLTIPPRYNYYFWVYVHAGQSLDFSFAGSSWRGADEVGFTIVSSSRSVLVDAGRVKQYSGSFTPTIDGNYSLTFDNSFSLFTSKTVVLDYHIRSSLAPNTFPQHTGSAITISVSQREFSGDIFVKNAFTLLAAIAVGILLIGAILGLHALLVVRPRKRGLYDAAPKRKTSVHTEGPSGAEKKQVVGPIMAPKDETCVLTEQVKKKCHYCGAEVRPEDSICGKCGMPALYRK
jgi:hypothetical protein